MLTSIASYGNNFAGRYFRELGQKIQNASLSLSETKIGHPLIYNAFLGAIQGLAYAGTSAIIDNIYENEENSSVSLLTFGAILALAFTAHRIARKTFVGVDVIKASSEGALIAAPKILLSAKWLIPLVSLIFQVKENRGSKNALILYVGETVAGNGFAPITLSCTKAFSAFFSTYFRAKDPPIVIFLNGTSSAGKTSIAKQIQKLSKDAFLYTGIDHFIEMLPPSYLPDGSHENLGFKVTVHPGPTRTVEVGLVAKRFIHSMHLTMKIMLDQGFNLVLDEVLISKDDFKEYLELFKGVKVLFVSIHPPLEVAEQRERTRGDRSIGFSRGFYSQVHQGKIYDLEIDSSKNTPEESAKQILDYLSLHSKFDAFESHRNSSHLA